MFLLPTIFYALVVGCRGHICLLQVQRLVLAWFLRQETSITAYRNDLACRVFTCSLAYLLSKHDSDREWWHELLSAIRRLSACGNCQRINALHSSAESHFLWASMTTVFGFKCRVSMLIGSLLSRLFSLRFAPDCFLLPGGPLLLALSSPRVYRLRFNISCISTTPISPAYCSRIPFAL
jgi:hypothetical protein